MLMQQGGKSRFQLVSLAISVLIPLILYFVIRPHLASDTEGLALAWFIPVIWALGSSLWLRRLNVFNLLGVVAYGITLAIAIFFGAGALPLKLHHAIVTGAIGLVCLISFALGKPVSVLFARRLARNNAQIETALADPAVVRRISTLTLIIGIACLVDTALQTALAILLSTGAFLIAATILHVATVVGIVLGAFVLWRLKSNR